MYVTPIRLDVLLNTNQISFCKGEWYVRRFDPDKVENGHIYSSVKVTCDQASLSFLLAAGRYGVSLRTKINLKKRSDLLGEINSDIKIMYSNKQNVT